VVQIASKPHAIVFFKAGKTILDPSMRSSTARRAEQSTDPAMKKQDQRNNRFLRLFEAAKRVFGTMIERMMGG